MGVACTASACAMPRLALLALLLALPALPAAAATGPRGSAYAAQGKAGQLAAGLRPPTLRSVRARAAMATWLSRKLMTCCERAAATLSSS